ncbi:MAG: hypothetical protein NXI22_13125, partial [bacterium]|nr:hypothetical protein [bacterium]
MSNESKTEDVAEFAAEKADSTTADAEAAQATQQTKKRRRRWGCCAAGCSLPIVLVLMLIVVVLSWQTSWKSKTRSLEAEIRNRGEPLTVAEADAYFASDRVDGDQVEKFFVAAKQIQKTSTYTKFGRRENGEMVGVEGELIPSDGFADEAFQAEVNSLEAAAIDMKAPV